MNRSCGNGGVGGGARASVATVGSGQRALRQAIRTGLAVLLSATAGAGALLAAQEKQQGQATQQKDQAQKRDPGEPFVNRLADESSLYLKQHRHNPVDWYPWGDEAFAQAKKLDRPIFLSIGYSACHWCHVMAEESFEDPKVAKFLNENFVCIKVDREERPDVDEVYMEALRAMGERGGWPLSAWLTSTGKPFYGGTYFPPTDANGRPGFQRVCELLRNTWRDDRKQLLDGADKLGDYLKTSLAPEYEPGEPTVELLAKVLAQAVERYDEEHPGFANPPGFAPKFPHATEIQALLRMDGDADRAHQMAFATLEAMRRGGIQDHLGGGFHRYSTDRRWHVPHFEKMLYSNALLSSCYLEAFLRSEREPFAATARSTLDYMLREMRAPGGGFYASQDAQSEGVEGKFFVWSKAEIDAVLGADSAAFCRTFGVSREGNWDGTNVLFRALPKPEVDESTLRDLANRLRLHRDERVHPGTDDKVLAAWNGLVLTAFADGYRILGTPSYREAAVRAADFLVAQLIADGRVWRSFQGGERRRHPGTLDDYAGLADGLLSVFEIDSNPRWLEAAQRLLRTVDERFSAPDGGFWSTADDHEKLLARKRSGYEAATPPGAALATRAMLRCGLLLGDAAMYERGVRSLRAHHTLLRDTPGACSSLVLAMQFHLGKPKEIVVVGDPEDARTQALLRAAWRRFPQPGVVASLHSGNRQALEKMSSVFRGKQAGDGGAPRAFVCERGVCLAPIDSPATLRTVR
ncbi:MAG: thioredoxin domain-containing protein [Planctomycetota bacterium]